MSPEFYYFYGKMMNMSFLEIRSMVYGRMLDLIACYQIKNEGAKIDWTNVEAISDLDVVPNWK